MNSTNQGIQPGETMFDYLKRKKTFMLQKTLSRNKNYNDSQVVTHSELQEKTRRNQSKETCLNKSALNNNKKIDSQSNTPKRVHLIQEERRPGTRSFLQMISPIRSKSPIQKESDETVKSSPRFSKKDTYKENYTKKVMLQKVENLRDLIENMTRSGRNLKEKFNFLSVELQPFFRHIQNCDCSKIQKKTQVIKAQLKAVHHNFKEFSTETSDESIDSFFKNFSQYINELEGQSLAQIKSNKTNLVNELTFAKNSEITELQNDKKKLEKELQFLRKEYEKLEKSYVKLEESAFQKIQKTESNQSEVIKKLQAQVDKLQLENTQFKEEWNGMKTQLSQKDSEIKKLIYERQKYHEECFNTINKVKTEQQEFLLNEIMSLKKQFNHDINEMAKMHTIKEEEYIFRLKDLTSQKDALLSKLDQLAESNVKMEECIQDGSAQAIRFKKQNQMLAIDMHRINEELYQHWLALKDIKTLSIRLDIFPKFKKIYEEMLFNQQLFL